MDKIDYNLEPKPYKYYIRHPAPPLSPKQEADIRHCIALQVMAAYFPDRITLTKMWSPWSPPDWHLLRLLVKGREGVKIGELMNIEAQNIIGKIRRQGVHSG